MPKGHAAAQRRQPTHFPASTVTQPSAVREIAPKAQTLAQGAAAQWRQLSVT